MSGWKTPKFWGNECESLFSRHELMMFRDFSKWAKGDCYVGNSGVPGISIRIFFSSNLLSLLFYCPYVCFSIIFSLFLGFGFFQSDYCSFLNNTAVQLFNKNWLICRISISTLFLCFNFKRIAWHYCDIDGRQASFLCPNGTQFSQAVFVCDWWFNVNCELSPHLYEINARLYQKPKTNPTQPHRVITKDLIDSIFNWNNFFIHSVKFL